MAVIRGARAFRQTPPEPTTAELRLIRGWIEDDEVFDWLYNQLILDEYRAILGRLKVPAHASGRFINLLRQGSTEVEVRNLARFSPDPQDDPFYHCAIASHADHIVTDKNADFPSPKSRKKPEIITPAEAVVRLRL
jgi:predicted nucleic acid-binding protein